MSADAYRAADRVLQAMEDRGSTLAEWADARGYRRNTVYHTVRRWAGRTDREPQGVVANHIMCALRTYLGPRVLPTPRTARRAA